MKSINKISLTAVKLPLKSPYMLSFVTINELSVIYCEISFDDGSSNWGECSPLPGYSEVDFSTAWKEHIKLAKSLINKSEIKLNQDGFNHCALNTALYSKNDSDAYIGKPINMAGLVQEDEEYQLIESLKIKRDQGYTTYKMKVGVYSIEKDLHRLERIQNEMLSSEKIRIDANQGLTLANAIILSKNCSKELVELIEQPLPINSWGEMSELKKCSEIELMLDESILGLDSLKSAVSPSKICDWVKLKLMKQGDIDRTHRMLKFASEKNLRVIFGNGVSGYLGNFQEAKLWHDIQKYGSKVANNPIESNGFLKVINDPFQHLLSFDSGKMICNEWQNPDFSNCEIVDLWQMDKI